MLEQGLSLLEPEGQMGGLKHTTQKQKTLEVLVRSLLVLERASPLLLSVKSERENWNGLNTSQPIKYSILNCKVTVILMAPFSAEPNSI